ncbi:hypothetical protein [Tenacibaculum maritimum]
MATDRNIVKSWFRKKMKPTAAQFSEFFESIYFKNEKIPPERIDKFQSYLDEKADVNLLEGYMIKINSLGLKFYKKFEIISGEVARINLPKGAVLYGFQLSSKTAARIEFSFLENFDEGYLGNLDGSTCNVLIPPFGYYDTIYVNSTDDTSIIPIIYNGLKNNQ